MHLPVPQGTSVPETMICKILVPTSCQERHHLVTFKSSCHQKYKQGICTNLDGGKNTTVTQHEVLKHCLVTDLGLMKHCNFACEIYKVTSYKQIYYSSDGIKLANLFKTLNIIAN